MRALEGQAMVRGFDIMSRERVSVALRDPIGKVGRQGLRGPLLGYPSKDPLSPRWPLLARFVGIDPRAGQLVGSPQCFLCEFDPNTPRQEDSDCPVAPSLREHNRNPVHQVLTEFQQMPRMTYVSGGRNHLLVPSRKTCSLLRAPVQHTPRPYQSFGIRVETASFDAFQTRPDVCLVVGVAGVLQDGGVRIRLPRPRLRPRLLSAIWSTARC